MNEQEPSPRDLARWISWALWVWGIFLAVGSYWLNHNIFRPLIVIACVGLFQGFWSVMLMTRRDRKGTSASSVESLDPDRTTPRMHDHDSR